MRERGGREGERGKEGEKREGREGGRESIDKGRVKLCITLKYRTQVAFGGT